jgi:hypothetical protein
MDRKWEQLSEGKRRPIFDAQLSDLKSVEVIEYQGDQRRLINALLERIRSDIPEAEIPAGSADRRRLVSAVRKLATRIQTALARDGLIEFLEAYRAVKTLGTA